VFAKGKDEVLALAKVGNERVKHLEEFLY